MLSEGAAYLVAEILSDTARLEGSPCWRPAGAGARLAWKTGTSYGHRDAWTVAYTPEFTVGVWLGNFSGKPSRELVGVRAAAPVAARILDQLYGGQARTWYSPPASVGTRKLCAASGMPLGRHCPQAAEGLFLREPAREGEAPAEPSWEGEAPAEPCRPRHGRLGGSLALPTGRSSDQPCSVHAEVQVDEKAGVRLCPLCAKGREHHVKVLECWPPELAAWLRQHGRGADLAPPHFAGCARRDEGDAPPLILSPASGQRYVLLEDDGPEGPPRGGTQTEDRLKAGLQTQDPPKASRQRLMLRAASRSGRVYWFIDGTLHAAGAPLEPAFWPLQRGSHTVVCSDDAGRSASVAIEVR